MKSLFYYKKKFSPLELRRIKKTVALDNFRELVASNLNYDYVTKLHFFDEQSCYTNPIVQLLCESSTD